MLSKEKPSASDPATPPRPPIRAFRVNGVSEVGDPRLVSLASTWLDAREMVLINEFDRGGPDGRFGLLMVDAIALGIDAKVNRLSKHRLRLIETREGKKFPASPREDDAMDVDVILNRCLKGFETLGGVCRSDGGKGLLGLLLALLPYGVTDADIGQGSG